MTAPLAYTIKGAAEALGISRSSLYELIGQGKVRTKKLGRATLVPAAQLSALLDGGPPEKKRPDR